MGKSKNFIFDFDGTLADSLPLYLDILYKGRTSSPNPVTDEQLAVLQQTPLLKMVGKLDVPRFSRVRILWHRWRHLKKRIGDVQSFSNLPEAIKTLHQEGYKLFVLSSNFEKNVRAFLEAHKLEQYFEGVYHTNVFLKKRGLRIIVKQELLEKDSTYYVANESLDMRAARDAGIHGLAVLWSGQTQKLMKPEHPTAFLEKPNDLLTFARR